MIVSAAETEIEGTTLADPAAWAEAAPTRGRYRLYTLALRRSGLTSPLAVVLSVTVDHGEAGVLVVYFFYRWGGGGLVLPMRCVKRELRSY